MAQTPVSDGLAGWCRPETLSPQSWLTGFSDNADTFLCAITAVDDDLVKKMSQHCCQSDVGGSGDGCYHWCRPHAKKTDDWATCISDHVYTDRLSFGTSCNSMGGIEHKNAVNNGRELRPAADPNSGVALGRSSKLSVLLGVMVLIKVMC